MGVLVEDLLTLARLDEVRDRPAEAVDLGALAATPRPTRAPPAPDRDDRARAPTARRSCSATPTSCARCSATCSATRSCTRPPGTPIEVAVARATTAASTLEVRDHGPGLPTDDADELFERFWRAEGGPRAGPSGGAGLGLAIVAGDRRRPRRRPRRRQRPGRRRALRGAACLRPPGFEQAAQELLRVRVLRVLEDLLGRTELDDPALVEEADACRRPRGRSSSRGSRSASSCPPPSGRGPPRSTSPTSSGSSALVTSSSSSARGRAANARAIATRCCWPPESSSGLVRPRGPRGRSGRAASRPRSSASARATSRARAAARGRRCRARSGAGTGCRPGRRGRAGGGPRPASTDGSVITSPSRKMSPSSISSSRSMQRSSVDLPEPEAPISATASCSRDRRGRCPCSTSRSPNALVTPRISRTGGAHSPAPAPGPSRSSIRASGIVTAQVEQRGGEQRRVVEVGRGLDLRDPEGLAGDAEDRDQRDVLLQRDEVVEQRRPDAAHRLRQDHVAHRLALGQPDRERRVALAAVDRARSRPGRPRRRRRRRRASARSPPSTTGSVGHGPCVGARSAGMPKPIR